MRWPGSRSWGGCAGRRAPRIERGSLAVLTDEGFAALEAAAPLHVESVRRHLFDVLSPRHLTQLREIQEALLDHLLPLAAGRGDVRSKLMEEARAQLDR